VQPRNSCRPTQHVAEWVPASVTRRCPNRQATQ
jgi:hypothetical protein